VTFNVKADALPEVAGLLNVYVTFSDSVWVKLVAALRSSVAAPDEDVIASASSVNAPSVSIEENTPVEVEFAPIAVPSIAPELMSTLVITGAVNVLFVNVDVLVFVTTLDGVMIADKFAMSYSGCEGQLTVQGNPLCDGTSRRA